MTINLFDYGNPDQQLEYSREAARVDISDERIEHDSTDILHDNLSVNSCFALQEPSAPSQHTDTRQETALKNSTTSVISLSSGGQASASAQDSSLTEDLLAEPNEVARSSYHEIKPYIYHEAFKADDLSTAFYSIQPARQNLNAVDYGRDIRPDGPAMTIQQLWGAKYPREDVSVSLLPLASTVQAETPFSLFLEARKAALQSDLLRIEPSVLYAIDPALKKLGIRYLRPHYEAVFANFVARRSVLASIPTSGGKSLLYTLPSVAFHSICVVITPTIALREDQIAYLRANSVNAIQIGKPGIAGTISIADLANTAEGVLFVTPEKLCNSDALKAVLAQLARTLRVCLFAIDECHLMLEWRGFRSDFKRIPEVLHGIIGQCNIPIMCLSASLPEEDSAQIRSMFQFAQMKILTFDVYRQNLKINLLYVKRLGAEKSTNFSQLETLKQHIASHDGKLLVYARKTAECDHLARVLPRTLYYHSECPNQLRNAQEWQNSPKVQVLAATVGFGMGVNVKQLNSVYLYDFPSSVSDYLQKIGRAGRSEQPGFSWFTWCANDIIAILKLILMDRAPGVARRLTQLMALNLIFQRPVCQFAQLQQYYVGYNLRRCGTCTGCAKEATRSYRKVDIRELANELAAFFGEHHLLAIKQGIKSPGVSRALKAEQFKDLEPENTALVVLSEMVVGGYAKILETRSGVLLKRARELPQTYFLTLW